MRAASGDPDVPDAIPAFGEAMNFDGSAAMNYDLEAARLKKDWAENPRWKGIKRGYTAEDVVRLRGTLHVEHTFAREGAVRLWAAMRDARPRARRCVSSSRSLLRSDSA